MNGLFALLLLASLIAFPIGLIKPAWILRRQGISRKKFSALGIITSITLFILFGLTSAESSTNVKGAVTSSDPIPTITQTQEIIATPTATPSSTPTPEPTSTTTPTPTQVQAITITPTHTPTPTPTTKITPTSTPQPTSTTTPSTYTNVDGQKIQSPTHYDNTPSGASARCRDGTYSFSTHRSGTCSHHGGVAQWL